jgi:tetratricopeptide (TPR) repeat protein
MQRRTADAKQLLTDALTIYRAADKAPNAAVGVCLHRLGQIALDEKQPAVAVRLFQQVVAIDESIYGSGHVEVADDLVMLAAAHAAMGQADLAEEIRARARAIEERAASNEEEADDSAP